MRPLLPLFALAISLLPQALPAQPPAQQPGGQPDQRIYRPGEEARPGELILFSNSNYTGRTYYVTGPRQRLDPPFPPMSIKVARGEQWQVCANYEYRPPCVTMRTNTALIAGGMRIVRSARPTGSGGPGDGFAGTGDPGPTLNGMASEFFRAPRDRGQRIVACPRQSAAAACAKETADRYCRAWGYAGGAAYQLLETVNREVYLADVLCKKAM
jgi:hypothetical protein